MATESMAEFWDQRAQEDPFFFVDNRLEYGRPDLERFWAGGREALDGMLEILGASIGPGDDVVEIGCGVGRITRVIADYASTVRAIDVSARMLDAARQANPELGNVEWLLGDGESLPVPDRSADACHSDVVFQHIPDPRVTLGYVSEMGRVLRPGGWAAFQISNARGYHRPAGLLTRARMALLARVRRAPRGQAHPAWIGSAVAIDDLRDTAARAGMSIERLVGKGTPHCLVLLRRAA